MPARSYEHALGRTHLSGSTLGGHLAQVAARHAQREALVTWQGVRWTYAQLWRRAGELAQGLVALGVERGAQVGIWSTDDAQWLLVQLATARIGAVLVNVNPAWRAEELADGLRRAQVDTLFLSPAFEDSQYERMLLEVCPELARGVGPCARAPDLRQAVIYEPHDPDGTAPRGARVLVWPQVLERAREVSQETLRAREQELDPDDPINVQFTSGTTGHPKAVVLTHHGLLNNALSAGELLGVGPQDRLCVPVPFYHCFGMVLANLLVLARGGTLVVPAPHFDPAATLRAIADEGCSVLHGVPTMFIELLAHPLRAGLDLSSLRTGIMAGAPCPPELVRQVVRDLGCADLRIGYGMTEASPLTHLTRAGDPPERGAQTVGATAPHLETKVIDVDTGRVVARGEQGEVCVRGYAVMRGYLGDREATREAVDEAGWLRTGDLGVMDEDGYLRITGRRKDMIVRGGENVYPAEVEAVLFEHPAIAEVAVFGLPDERLGEQVAAWVRLEPGQQTDAEELRCWARERMAHFKVPRRIWFVEELPETITGKVQKFRMREIASRWLQDPSEEVTT